MPNTTNHPRRILENPWLWRIATAFWCGVIFWGSSLPGSRVPGRYGPLGHFGEYAVLGALALAATRPRAARARMIIALAFVALFALSDEFHQSFVPARVPDPVDWLVDMAGALAATLAWVFAARLSGRRKG